MGGLGTFKESNDDRQNAIEHENSDTIGSIQIPNLYECYYCDKSFKSDNDRDNHIRKEHNFDPPQLSINEMIVDGEQSIEKVVKAEIDLGNKAKTKVSINDSEIKYKGSKIDLMPYLKSGKDQYTIKINQKSYKIWKWTRSQIANPSIDEIINKWNRQVKSNYSLSPSAGDYPKGLNESEKKYLDGFYEYFTACKQDIDPENRKKRLIGAFTIFSKMKSILTPKARFVLQVIYFKWNDIKDLKELSGGGSDMFDIVLNFFNEEKTNEHQREFYSTNEPSQIFIESEVDQCLKAILAFQTNDLDSVKNYLENWDDDKITLIKDKNMKDKIWYLKARSEEKLGKKKLAEKYRKKNRESFNI